MSVFTEEEAERELYDDMDHPLVKFVMKQYWDDKIIEWSDCKSVLDYILTPEIHQETKIHYLVDWFQYNPEKEL